MKTRSTWLMAGVLWVAAVTGCSPTTVTRTMEYRGSLPKPGKIYVYTFAVSPEQVKLQRGVAADVEGLAEGASRTDQERAVGRKVADALANRLVEQLQSMGFQAVRVGDDVPADGTILQIHGQFLSIDEGNPTQRVVIGLGLGRSDVRAAIQVYETLEQDRTLVARLEADAKSGYKPGAAETMGAGAAAGALAASAATTAAGVAGSEMFGANVEADAGRMAKGLARQLGEFFVSKGWMDESALPSMQNTIIQGERKIENAVNP